MIRISRRQRWWLIALAALGVVAALSGTGQLRGLENAAADARARVLRREVPSDIVIVGIDSASVHALDTWPWPRRHHAKLLQNLIPAKPRRVFFDVDFSSPTNSLDDAMLDSALARRRDFSVLLPAFTQYARGAEGQRIVSRPLPRFARSADLVAVNGDADVNGTTREWPSYTTLGGERTPSVIDLDRVLHGDQSVTIDFSIAPESFTYVSVCRPPGRSGDARGVRRTRRYSSARRRWSSVTSSPCRCTAPCPVSCCRRWPPKP